MSVTTDNKQALSVSVVIPAYNAGEFIARAIESVLAQTRPANEIIVVDDGSTDNTAQVVKKYGSSVNYIRRENAGVSAARNTGIEAATSQWIAFLDADDEWLSEKLQLQTELLHRNPELVWAGANYYQYLCVHDRKGPHIPPDKIQEALKGKEYFDDFFRTSLPRGSGWTGTMLVKTEVLKQAGMFNVGQHIAEDTDLWFRIGYREPRFGFISKPLAIYYMHLPQSLSLKYNRVKFNRDFIRHHLKLSAEFGRAEAFKPIATRRLSASIRSMLFENRPEDIRELMKEFDELLPVCFKTIVRLLLIFPRATATVCHMISKIVRALNLRKQIVRPPRKSQENKTQSD